MKNLIFSLLIKFDIQNDNGPCDLLCSKIYFDYKDVFLKDKLDYARRCDADFILVENDDYFDKVWAPEMKEKFPYVSMFDIIQYYKIRLAGLFAEKYDNVLYLDFDMTYGNAIPPNIFESFDFTEKLVARKKTYDMYAGDQFKIEPSSRKAFIANFLCNINSATYAYQNGGLFNFEMWNINTGLLGLNIETYNRLNYFEHLEKNLPKLNMIDFDDEYDLSNNTIRFSNEALITYCTIQELVENENVGIKWNCDIIPPVIKKNNVLEEWYFLHLCDKVYTYEKLTGIDQHRTYEEEPLKL